MSTPCIYGHETCDDIAVCEELFNRILALNHSAEKHRLGRDSGVTEARSLTVPEEIASLSALSEVTEKAPASAAVEVDFPAPPKEVAERVPVSVNAEVERPAPEKGLTPTLVQGGAKPKTVRKDDRRSASSSGVLTDPRGATRVALPNELWFKQKWHPLSNLYVHGQCGQTCIIQYRGFEFLTSEHAYQFEKARRHGYFDSCWEFLDALSGTEHVKDVMNKGQALTTCQFWKNHDKFVVMEELMTAKYHYCWGFRKFLMIDSGDAILLENTAHKAWGGVKTRKNDFSPENRLGKIQMRIRAASREEFRRFGPNFQSPLFNPVPIGHPRPYTRFRQYPVRPSGAFYNILPFLEGQTY